MKLFWVLVLLCVPTTGVDDVRARYISSLLKSGWTVHQLQENGIIEKPNTTTVATIDSSTDTVTTPYPNDTSAVTVSTSVVTTTEIPITSTTLPPRSTTVPEKVISVPTSVNKTLVGTFVNVSNVVLAGKNKQKNKVVVPLLKNTVTQIPKVLTTAVPTSAISQIEKGKQINNSNGSLENMTEVVLSPSLNVSDRNVNVTISVVNVTNVSDNFTVDLFDMGYLQSGLSGLFRDFLIDWEEQVMRKANDSTALLPNITTWEPVESVKAAAEGKGGMEYSGSPDSVLIVDHPQRAPLFLLLLTLVAIIAGNTNTFGGIQVSLMSMLNRVCLFVFCLLTVILFSYVLLLMHQLPVCLLSQ